MAYCVSGNYSISGCLSVGVDLTGNGSNNRIWSKAGNQETYNPATYAGNYAQILIQPATSCVNDTALIRYARPDGGVEAVFGFVQTQYGGATADFIIQGSSCGYSEKFRIAGNNVGIGTCSPCRDLHVVNGGGGIMRIGPYYTSGADRDYLEMIADGYCSRIITNNEWMGIQNCGGPLLLQPNSGNVGIGVAYSCQKLYVAGGLKSSGTTELVWFGTCDATQPLILAFKAVGGATSADRGMAIISTEAGIGGNFLDINETSTRTRFFCSGNVNIGSCAATSYRLNVNGAFYAAGSSQDYKQSIFNYNTDSCMFMKLKPVTYQYKDEYCHLGKELKSGTQIGLIAEEVAESHPELAILVNEENEKVVRNVDYEKLTIILLSELQKLRQEVDQLKNK